MAAVVNAKRVWIGAIAGGVVWTAWGFLVGMLVVGQERYAEAEADGVFLSEPRYPFFMLVWILSLFAMSYGCAWLYSRARAVAGAGPKTAALVGCWVGFAAGFPESFAHATWLNADRMLPLGWTLDLWVGAILATLVAGWLYRDP